MPVDTEQRIEKKLEVVETAFMKYGFTPMETKNRLRFGHRLTYRRGDDYYRAGMEQFDGKDYIVISAINDPDFANADVMEDVAAFPWTLPDEKIEKEVRYILGLEEYPEGYPDY